MRDFSANLTSPAERAQRLRELHEEYEGVKKQIAELQAARWQTMEGAENDERTQAAWGLILGENVTPEVRDFDARIRKLAAHQLTLEEAQRLLRAQVDEDRKAEARAARKELRPAYKAAAREVFRCLFALEVANANAAAITRRASGLAPLWPAAFPTIGESRNPMSPAGHWMKEAEKHGVFTRDELKAIRAEVEKAASR